MQEHGQSIPGSGASQNQRSTTARRRRQAFTLVRWAMILLCALLILDKPASAAILAPLLVVAVLLGSRVVREYVLGWRAAVDDAEHEQDVPRRKR